MAHSSIRIKKCKFPGCPYYPACGAEGYCWRHESAASKAEKNQKIYRAKKEKNLVQVFSPAWPNDNALSLRDWFLYHVRNSAMVCDNCDANLNSYSYLDWWSSQHHILEKADFPSVKANLLNHLVLGKYCCHSQWHTNQENASKMKVFSRAEEIVIKLYPLLTSNERKRISVFYTFEQV